VDPEFDVVVIGAGAAGLAAAQELLRAGRRVCCLEAQDRIGGRILTVRDARAPVPVELGAEFVHGRPSSIAVLAQKAGVELLETAGRAVNLVDGGDLEERADDVLEDLARSATGQHDETFESWLTRANYSGEKKHEAVAYVEGFNAARREVIGVESLAHDWRASAAIEGDRVFRVREGYDTILGPLAAGVDVRLSTIVELVAWKPGAVTVHVRGGDEIRARRVVITVSLGVLQSGAIRFDPEPAEMLAAARALRFGDAFRVTFAFERAFWDESRETKGAGFLFSDEPLFPVWWTARPMEAPMITGWSAGPKADALIGQGGPAVIAEALSTLSRIAKIAAPSPLAVWFHDWHADPWVRGAYSYVPAGAMPARRKLAEPVADSLYFAGEHTDLVGYGGTVHGAIASGLRAAGQIVGG
jgi:monoamine oxidase